MYVTKRDGQREPVHFDKISQRIQKLIMKDENNSIDATFVSQKVVGFIHSGITTEELDVESAKICVNLCTTHPLYSFLGGRILVSNLHKKTSESFTETFIKIQEDTKFIDSNFYDWVLENSIELDKMVVHSRDYNFDYFGFKTLERAYLIKNQKTNYIYERPQYMYLRVAAFLNKGNLSEIKKTYDLLSTGKYIHASPTLFNAGSTRSQLSSCFLIGTDDSIDDITNTWKSVSAISKWGGGIGLHVSNIRSKGSLIRGTNGPSSGIIPMLQVYNSIARYVNQCFLGITKIYTNKGLIAMKNLKVGDSVFTIDGSLKEITKIYSDIYQGNILEMYVNKFNNPLNVTEEHPFYVVKNSRGDPDWVEAKNITSDDMILIAIPKYEKDLKLYEETDCYFYGVLLVLGNVVNNNINIEYNGDKIFEFVKNYLDINLIRYTIDENNNIRFGISSKFKFMENMLYDESRIKKIDESMLNLPINKIKMIIKGIFDSSEIDNLSINVGSLNILESLKYLFLRMGILANGYCNLRQSSWVFDIPQVEEVVKLLEINFDNSNCNLNSKYNDQFLFTKIIDVKTKIINEPIYDLEIDSNHNYLTEFGLVHNGGKRKGSIAVYLEPHHADIFEFLDLRKNFGDENLRARDLFLALWISDLFMKQVKNNDDWYLMCPDECPGLTDVWGKDYEDLYWQYVKEKKYKKKVEARKLMMAIWESQQETGTPYITYKDHVNSKSNQKNIGTIKSSNLCNEIVEYSDKDEHAVCNLASIALNKMLTPYDFGNKEFIIYTKKECKFCKWAKNFLDSKKCYYQEVVFDKEALDSISASQKFIDDLQNKIGDYVSDTNLTFPQIFYTFNQKTEYIGGFEELINKTGDTYNFKLLNDVAYTATKNLNRVIDINFYPTIETKRSNLKHRPIGLGIQGLADTLVKMRIPFDSDEAVKLNSEIMETIYFAAMTASNDISKERCEDMKKLVESKITFPEFYDEEFKIENITILNLYHKLKPNVYEINREVSDRIGSYSSFEGSPTSEGIFQFDMWDYDSRELKYNWNNLKKDVKRYGIRNSLLVALMPTASTSQILSNNECFEFFTSNIYTRNTLAGDFPIINKYLVNDLIDIGEWNSDLKDLMIAGNGSIQHITYLPDIIRRLYQTQWELKQIWVLKAAKARGPFVDQTQSMNIFMAEPNDQKLNSCLFWGWENGLKSGIYYLRTKPSANAIKVTIDPRLLQKVEKSEECELCSA